MCVLKSAAEEFQEVIAANVMHNYAVIRRAAEDTKAEWLASAKAPALDMKRLKKLTFSDFWVHSFIKRLNFSRQRITSAIKANRPVPFDVQRIMADIQRLLLSMGFTLSEI